MTQTDDARLAFRFAPCINHESVAKMSPAQQEQALHELIDLRDAVKRHIYSPKASPQTRLIALDLLFESAWRTRGRQDEQPLMDTITDPMPVHYPTIGKRLGIHRNSVGKEYKAFHKVGLLRMSTRTDEDDKDHVDVAINPELPVHADRLPTKGERPRPAPGFKSAGTGKHCSECGSGDVDVICRNCGSVEQLGELPHEHAAAPVREEAVFPSTAPPLVAAAETLSTREVLSVDGLQDSTREVLSVDPQELERQAAQLLLAIAGEHSEFIEMIPTPQKYSTVHRSLTLEDIQDHLQGGQPKGTRLYRASGMTRALVFDEDTAEGFARLKEAAQLLVAADDFKPILEPTPEGCKHTGGKLFINFEADVDTYSAKQTCYQYTGGLLRHCKEVWPPETDTGNRVRLPGGTYIHPNFTAPCHLFDEHMQNGIGPAAMLLTRLTPASVVNEYTRPEPPPEPQRAQPAPRQGGYLEKDLAKQYIADFNARCAWSDIAQLAGGFIRGKFLAVWRNDTTPNMAIWQKTDLAKDFARPEEPLMDKYDVWCRIMAHERSMDWQQFKRRDLAERCAYRRSQLEQVAS